MQAPDFQQTAGGGANINIVKNPDGTFTGTIPIPGFQPITANTEQEVMQLMAAAMQQMMGQGQGQMQGGPAGPMAGGPPPMMAGRGPMG
jgi:hypothetical protein